MRCLPLIAAALAALMPLPSASAADRPNILWIMSEDNSASYLRLYDPAGADTPRIEALAADGLVFERAFSCSPVCSVARTTLITGCYAPRVGTQFHRKAAVASLPEGLRMFPAYLREAGYHATNNAKEDYNAAKGDDTWDDSSRQASWRDRPSPGQPFFHVQTFTDSHESSLHFPETLPREEKTAADPATMVLAPYHPDSPVFRYTHARYLDRMRAIDVRVGELIDQLAADGLLEETVIFYFGDHGGALPRSKGYCHESGLHVPLVVRVPEKWSHLAPAGPGSRVGGFVEFVDFAPAALRLAGLPVPEQMDGRPFLGGGITLAELEARDEAFGHADRFDEKIDMVRTLRKGNWKYHRNYEPFYPDALQNNYRYLMLAWQDWRERWQAGSLQGPQLQFFQPKAPEALYDLERDPHELVNLAGDPAHAATLADLRARLQERVRSLPDLSFYPESVLVEEAMDHPAAYGRSKREEIARLADTADLALLPFAEAWPGLSRALESDHPWERWWALTALCAFGEQAGQAVGSARALLADPQPLNRARAALFLAIAAREDPGPAFREALRASGSDVETLILLNMAVYLRDHGPRFDLGITRDDVPRAGGETERRLAYLTGEGNPRAQRRRPAPSPSLP